MSRHATTQRVLHQASRQGGVVTRRQVLRLGASDAHVGSLLRSGVLRQAHAGVYVLSGTRDDHPLAVRAAIAATGPGTAASHASAAWLWRLVDRPPSVVHLTTAGLVSRHRLHRVVDHRSGIPFQRRMVDGVPCTDPARTLVDLAGMESISGADLAGAVDRALAGGQVRLGDLEAAAAPDRMGRRGSRRLRGELIDLGYVGGPGPSVLEIRAARLVRAAGLPRPTVEHRAGAEGRYRIDLAFAEVHLAVELFGYAWHHSPDQLGADLARQRHLVQQGWTVLVYTWRQVTGDPAGVAAEIAAAHARLTAEPPSRRAAEPLSR